MAPTPPRSLSALVLDANVVIAISTKETSRDAFATAGITNYVNLGFHLYAPGVIVGDPFPEKIERFLRLAHRTRPKPGATFPIQVQHEGRTIMWRCV